MTETGPGAVSPKLAASLLLVRDAPSFQVLMVERHRNNAVGPGAMVFPGGKLESQDSHDAWAATALGWDSLDADSRSLRICAIRETYEETALLLAQPRTCWRSAGESSANATSRQLKPVETSTFLNILRKRDLALDLEGLTPFARWITPHGIPARFDATFFIATAPDDQLAASDGFETVSAEWIEPLHALSLAEQGERTLMPPTRVDLKRLGESWSVAGAIAAARARPVSTMRPYLVLGPNGYVPTVSDEAL